MEIIASLIPVLILGIPFILWIAMLVHAIRNNIPDKVLWVIVLILGGTIGGIVYYFAVYSKHNKKTS